MKIKITLYGRYKKLTETGQLELTVPENATVWHLIDTFVQKYPTLTKDKNRMMVTKNNTFAPPTTHIHTNDAISIAPPLVSGG